MYNFVWSLEGYYYAIENPTICADKNMNVYGGGGGGTSAPKPTAEEIELQQLQIEALKGTRTVNELLTPLMLQSLGLVAEDYVPGHYGITQVTNPEWTRWSNSSRGMNQITGEYNSDARGVEPPKTIDKETWIQSNTSGYRRMTEDERLAVMSPTERANYDILKLQQDRMTKALKGELPISPALEEDIAKQEAGLEESLSRRLGSGWETSTPGIQAKSEFDKRSGLLREEARRGELTTGQGLLLAQQGYMSGARQEEQAGYTGYGNRLFPLMQGAGAAQQPYQFNRQLGFQANQVDAQSSGKTWGAVGSLAGAGVAAYATYAGLAALAA